MKNIKIFIFILIVTLATMISTTFADSKSVFPTTAGVATIVNHYNGYSYITFDGRYFKSGDQVHVYSDSSARYQIGDTPLVFNRYLDDVIVKLPHLGIYSGSLYVTLTDAAGEAESDPVKVEYGPEVTVTNNVDKPDTVAFTGLVAKDIAKVYASDGTTTLGTATASVDGDVVVSLTKQLPEPPVGGSFLVYVTVKSDKQSEGSKAAVTYSPNGITVAPVGTIAVAQNPADIVVENNLTTPDTVTFLNLKAKDVATVYAPDPPDTTAANTTFLTTSDSTIFYATAKTTVLGTATATKDGDLVIKLAKQLSETNKNIYVSVKNYNLFQSPVTLVKYYRAGQTPATDPSNLKITITPNTYSMVTTSNMVFVSGVNANDIVTVYDSGTNNLIGIATVSSGNNYVVINFISTSHSIYLKNKNPDKLISASSSLITLK